MHGRTVLTTRRATTRWFQLFLGVVVLVACASLLVYTIDIPKYVYERHTYKLPVITDEALFPEVWRDVSVVCTGLEDVSVMVKYDTLGGTINQYLSHISAFAFADALNAQVRWDARELPRVSCYARQIRRGGVTSTGCPEHTISAVGGGGRLGPFRGESVA